MRQLPIKFLGLLFSDILNFDMVNNKAMVSVRCEIVLVNVNPNFSYGLPAV